MLLHIANLSIDIVQAGRSLRVVQNLSFGLDANEVLCIVGESGSGKSMTALSILNLLPVAARRTVDRLDFRGIDLASRSERAMRDIRGNLISMIFQEPMTALNPSLTIGAQLEDVFLQHGKGSRLQAIERAKALLKRVGIADASERLLQYPHQLSGGLRQRVMIAMALMCGPKLLLADEPTTALDVTIQAEVLALLRELREEYGLGLLLVTHDFDVVASIADKVIVMYSGEVVETGTVRQVLRSPMHPYTQGLLQCIPRFGESKGQVLHTIPGQIPPLAATRYGCAFADRCPHVEARCRVGTIGMTAAGTDHAYRCIAKPDDLRRSARTDEAAR